MRKKYILLDWDGCLAKTLDIWLKVFKEVVNKRGIQVEDDLEFVEKSFGKWEKGFEAVGVADSVKAYKEALQKVEEEIVKVELYPNAVRLLKGLKLKGKKIALLTSSFRHLVYPAIKKNRLQSYFDLIITKDETIRPKPDPWIVNTALEKLGGDKKHSVVVGDSDHDILLGKNAKVTTVLYYPEHNKKFYRKELLIKHTPDFIITDLLELIEITDKV